MSTRASNLLITLVLFLVTGPSTGCFVQRNVERGINEQLDRFVTLFNAGDAAAITRLYSMKAKAEFPERMELVKGRKEIQEYYQEFFTLVFPGIKIRVSFQGNISRIGCSFMYNLKSRYVLRIPGIDQTGPRKLTGTLRIALVNVGDGNPPIKTFIVIPDPY